MEVPYASILDPKYKLSHCSHCLLRTFSLIPCNNCTWAMFCSQQCMNGAKSYHDFECSLMPSVLNLCKQETTMITVRTISIAGVELLTKFVQDKSNTSRTFSTNEEKRKRGFNADGKILSNDFNAIYNLGTNIHKRHPYELMYLCILAACLKKCLKLDHLSESSELGGLILHLLLVNSMNSYGINEYIEVPSCAIGYKIMMIATAIYSFSSLLNHSCDPNVNQSYLFSIASHMAIKSIPKGTQIFSNYGTRFTAKDRKARQKYLQKEYLFDCNCEPCSHHWPSVSQVPQFPLKLNMNEEMIPQKIQETLEELNKIKYKIKNCTKYLEMLVPKACEIIELLDKHGKRSSELQVYLACQMVLKEFQFLQGNCCSADF